MARAKCPRMLLWVNIYWLLIRRISSFWLKTSAAFFKVSNVTESLSESRSLSSEERLVCIRSANSILERLCCSMSWFSWYANTLFTAMLCVSSYMPSSWRKSSRELPIFLSFIIFAHYRTIAGALRRPREAVALPDAISNWSAGRHSNGPTVFDGLEIRTNYSPILIR